MPILSELERSSCGATVRGAAYAALFHLMLHGLFIVSFVFSNSSYPPFYWVDYMFGGAGAALLFFSIIGSLLGSVRSIQWLRSILGVLILATVILVVVSTFMYTCRRWNDVISTALTRSLRKPVERDFPDYFWYTLVVTSCVFSALFLIYLIYIVGFFCNKYQTPNTIDIYSAQVIPASISRRMNIPPESNTGRTYKPYPVQENSK